MSKVVSIDWILFAATVPLVLAGLVTMNTFTDDSYFFIRQSIWLLASFAVFFGASLVDWRFLRQSGIVAVLYGIGVITLIALLLLGPVTRGAQGWFNLFGFSVQPAEFMKLLLIIILAKYFTRRHVAIANIRHIIISGLYAFIPFVLIFFQPDFGSAMILFFIWFGLILIAGISKKHLFLVLLTGILTASFLWLFVLADYQKSRVLTVLHPLADIQGAGYNAFQSMVAVGSGQIFGKGVGYGSQSRLEFLPEHQTDFIFAAFAEEWGLIGAILVFALFGVVVWRIIATAIRGATNFEVLFGFGLVIMLASHFIIHVGMNVGWMPITGLPLPFLSYGGSHLLAEFLGLGMLMGMRRYSLSYHRDDVHNEFLGPQ
ncbi:MAG: FtsW/RodA/SpoVE family cell cycle protein [Candidatus Paceibacterota bacterium]